MSPWGSDHIFASIVGIEVAGVWPLRIFDGEFTRCFRIPTKHRLAIEPFLLIDRTERVVTAHGRHGIP
jgi:hypothetical protein